MEVPNKLVVRAEARIQALEEKLAQARRAHEVAKQRLGDFVEDWTHYMQQAGEMVRPEKEEASQPHPAAQAPSPAPTRSKLALVKRRR